MTKTRAKIAAGELDHLISICMTNKPTNSGLKEALAEMQVTAVMDLMALPTDKINSLEYIKEGTVEKVPGWASQSLVHLRAFVRFQRSEGNKDYFSYTYDEYGDYLLDTYNPDAPHAAPAARSSAQSSKPSGSFARPPADDFKRSVKRDKAHYKVLKTNKEWDNWNRSTVATARSHGCENVLDPNYKPQTQEEKDLFDEQQKFMYSVFEENLQTNKGKHYVRQYIDTYDAQKIYRDLAEYATESTAASLSRSDLLEYITTYTLHDSGWKGSSEVFILNWCDKMRKYEDLVDKKDHFNGPVKRTMLENAVRGVSELNQVKTQDAHDAAHGGKPLTYDAYLNLLLSKAITYDAARGLTRNSKRTIQAHEFGIEEEDSHVDESFDIDTDLASLEIHNADRKPTGRRAFRPSMRKEQWNSLSIEEQALWDKLSPQSKAVILGHRQPPHENQQGRFSSQNLPGRFTPTSNSRTQANLHNISAADYIAMVHSQHTSDDEAGDSTFYDSATDFEEIHPDPPKGVIKGGITRFII